MNFPYYSKFQFIKTTIKALYDFTDVIIPYESEKIEIIVGHFNHFWWNRKDPIVYHYPN